MPFIGRRNVQPFPTVPSGHTGVAHFMKGDRQSAQQARELSFRCNPISQLRSLIRHYVSQTSTQCDRCSIGWSRRLSLKDERALKRPVYIYRLTVRVGDSNRPHHGSTPENRGIPSIGVPSSSTFQFSWRYLSGWVLGYYTLLMRSQNMD